MKVLVVGVGGLGTPALLALADAGVRKLTVIDPDRVELTNLHRQILYRESDIGRAKVAVVQERLERRFLGMCIETRREAFTHASADIVLGHDIVLDGTDRFATKLVIADACIDRGIKFVFAGVVGHEGQVLAVDPFRSACPRCLFDEAPPPGAAPTCDEVGILGPIAGVVAAEQVRRALALGSGDASVLDALWTFDGRKAREIKLRRALDCRGCGSRRDQRGWSMPDVAVVDIHAPLLDLSGQVCPNTFIETKKALVRLHGGQRLWVQLTSDESARNVPASVIAAGYRILRNHYDGAQHRILIECPKEETDASTSENSNTASALHR